MKENGSGEIICKELVSILDTRHEFAPIDLVYYSYAMQMKYCSYLVAIRPSEDTIFSEEKVLSSKWNDELNQILLEKELSLFESFAKAKFCLEQFFLLLTKQGVLEYTYHESALIASKQFTEKLGVSKTTISRYVELGLEKVHGVGHRCYPQHNLFYWKDGVWASRIQVLYQHYRLRNQKPEDVLLELKKEIGQFEEVYRGTFEEVFGSVTDPYELVEPDDYFNWRDASDEIKKIATEY